ncbi:2-oxo-4-hydroxy-4-carboxy-5-ureidoimidazoline decarboxylase [Cnuibacter physcomitrellae]|uniref:2-oxo-4-hydroxy-4-carboxy-5-ureidoimidazoline decarboxylase n=1 Tax=Cnuibacter physcomitrellae TaxID=1619308 RepID=UPI002175E400|nr:2-oxo-4-hydroxy-4-carboxy-5-ureidoimidazoline decarboxylase [Cnuibacter physcomitrellae]MCS5496433.1 2-oxo-4-hydroxy-4-carboxy-5-ureidoimidazoline decarboxylase [Cnuibacter physcomitrellae]
MADAVSGQSNDELREALLSCLGVERFADDVVAAGPYSDNAALLAAADDVAASLTPAEVDAALAHHPRIGERAQGEGQAQRFSRSEQSTADASDEHLAAAIADGNRAYEARFDRVFLIRAAGRSRAEILSELQRRLELDDATEAATVASELHDITMLRLASLYPVSAEAVPAAPAPSPEDR